MVIHTNLASQSAASNLQSSQALLTRSLARLSSGSRLVNPSDDVAGTAVSMRLDAQVLRLNAAGSNVGNAISFAQTQDAYLKNIARALDRMGELAILSQDVTKNGDDRALYNGEFTRLAEHITKSLEADFNSISLFSTSPGSDLFVTIDGDGNTFQMEGINVGVAAYSNATSGPDISTSLSAVTALENVRIAIQQVASDRAVVGAHASRLHFTSDQLQIAKENLNAASSRIKDVDVAEESTLFARYNILVQAGTALLAQANQQPQHVLRLLQ
jgi:flagellin